VLARPAVAGTPGFLRPFTVACVVAGCALLAAASSDGVGMRAVVSAAGAVAFAVAVSRAIDVREVLERLRGLLAA